MYPVYMELFALIRAMSRFVFMGSWLLGPHASLSPWLNAEAGEKQDNGMGGRALGESGDEQSHRVGITSTHPETITGTSHHWVACSWNLGVSTTFLF